MVYRTTKKALNMFGPRPGVRKNLSVMELHTPDTF